MEILIALGVYGGSIGLALLILPWIFAVVVRYCDWVEKKTRRRNQ